VALSQMEGTVNSLIAESLVPAVLKLLIAPLPPGGAVGP
jgi:hypothetical protein